MNVVTATSSEEARNPVVSIPVATIISMAAVTIGYILVSAALTLMVPYWTISTSAALPEAFSNIGLNWAKYVVSIGALCGMTTTLFGSLFSLPRCMYAMASDGLLFSFLGSINQKTQVSNNHRNQHFVIYGCETWSATLREEHRMRIFKNRVMKKIFRPKMEQATEDKK
jgi:amino acid transporter